MPPSSRKKRRAPADPALAALVGAQLLVPRHVFPNEKLKPGQGGWAARVVRVAADRPGCVYVKFPGHAEEYFFPGTEVEKWVRPRAAAAAAPGGAERAPRVTAERVEAAGAAAAAAAAAAGPSTPAAAARPPTPAARKRAAPAAPPAAPPAARRRRGAGGAVARAAREVLLAAAGVGLVYGSLAALYGTE